MHEPNICIDLGNKISQNNNNKYGVPEIIISIAWFFTHLFAVGGGAVPTLFFKILNVGNISPKKRKFKFKKIRKLSKWFRWLVFQ